MRRVRGRWVLALFALGVVACSSTDSAGDSADTATSGAVETDAILPVTSDGPPGAATTPDPSPVAEPPTGDDGPPADAAAYTIIVDNGLEPPFPASYNGFYPSSIRAHPGDSVTFSMPVYQGEPHNVALGSVATGAADAYAALPPDTLVFPGGPLPEVTADQAAAAAMLPASLPPNMESTEVSMTKLAPCWLVGEDPPLGEPCPPESRDTDQIFTGEESYVASKVFIESGDEFTVELAPDIEPGTYSFICTLHPTSMFGDVEVVDPAEETPSPGDVAEAAATELAELNGEHQPIADELAGQVGTANDTGVEVQAGAVLGGLVPPFSLNVFPDVVSVEAGESVTWAVYGAHMLTFNPPADLPLFTTLQRGDDDIVQPTEANLEVPGPGQPGMPAEFSLEPVTVDGGDFDGSEFLHTGLLYGRIGPLPEARYALTFSSPGVYTYYCMRHPGMLGSVEVT